MNPSLSFTPAIALPSAAISARQLSFYWAPTYQRFACDDVVTEWNGTTQTNPSHDLCHLIIAANGQMPWLPHGERSLVCFAEFNAVFLENLFDRTCNAIVSGTSPGYETLLEAIEFMEWFVNEHYSPFPVSHRSAVQRFCRRIDPFLVTRLFPYYLQVRQYEHTQSDYRQAEYQLHFSSQDQPVVDELGWIAQWAIYRQLVSAQDAFGRHQDDLEMELKREQAIAKVDALVPMEATEPVADELEAIKMRLAAIEARLGAGFSSEKALVS